MRYESSQWLNVTDAGWVGWVSWVGHHNIFRLQTAVLTLDHGPGPCQVTKGCVATAGSFANIASGPTCRKDCYVLNKAEGSWK